MRFRLALNKCAILLNTLTVLVSPHSIDIDEFERNSETLISIRKEQLTRTRTSSVMNRGFSKSFISFYHIAKELIT